MNLTEAREEMYQWLLEHDDPEMRKLAESWKEVGKMMEAGLSGDDILAVIHRRAHRELSTAVANALERLKEQL